MSIASWVAALDAAHELRLSEARCILLVAALAGAIDHTIRHVVDPRERVELPEISLRRC